MKRQLGLAAGLLIAAVVIAVGVHAGWWQFSGTIGSLRLNHVLGIVGAAYILVSLSVYALFRMRSPQQQGQLTTAEIFGNLVAFMLITAHFAQQTARSPLPVLGTGLAAYILVGILVVVSVVWNFTSVGRIQMWRLLFLGALGALYVDVGIHALRNFGVL